MTALSEYDRLESTGLWRPNPSEQRRDVIVSVGDATLVITDTKDQPLAHWSLPAVARANPGQRPAIYHPDGDPGETLELPADEAQMIDAIERVRTAIERNRPHPGRLRLAMTLSASAVVLGLAVFWLPGAMLRHTVSVVPDVNRAAIGDALLTRIQRVTGIPCAEPRATEALAKLGKRLPAPNGKNKLVVVRSGVKDTVHLPGGAILVNSTLIEDYDEPDVVAGYVIAERLRTQLQDPLERLLEFSGLIATFRMLTTGVLDDASVEAYSEHLLTEKPARLDTETLLAGFEAWSVRSTPFAYALDVSGETTLGLIEADPFATTPPDPLLSDSDWLRLQNICGG